MSLYSELEEELGLMQAALRGAQDAAQTMCRMRDQAEAALATSQKAWDGLSAKAWEFKEEVRDLRRELAEARDTMQLAYDLIMKQGDGLEAANQLNRFLAGLSVGEMKEESK